MNESSALGESGYVKNRTLKNPAVVANDSTQSASYSARTSEPGLLWIGDVYLSREWSGEMGRALNSYQKCISATGMFGVLNVTRQPTMRLQWSLAARDIFKVSHLYKLISTQPPFSDE